MATQRKVLEAIAASGAAMSVLDSPECAVEAGRPAALNDDGTLAYGQDGEPVDAGTPNRTLGDLVRDALSG